MTTRLTRRIVLGVGLGLAVALPLTWVRPTSPLADWNGSILSAREAAIVVAAAEAILPDVAGEALPEGGSFAHLALLLDAYLVGMPDRTVQEIRGLLRVLEHGTALGQKRQTLTRLTPTERLEFFERLTARGGLRALLVRGIRDLLLLARWQDPRSWSLIGWPGPWIPGRPDGEPVRPDGLPQRPSRYDSLVAVIGVVPRSST